MVKSLRTLIYVSGFLIGLSGISQAQSITVGTLPASFVCPPGTLSVPFSATGPFGSGNIFSAQLSDASGNFPGTTIGSVTANPASATTLTISSTIAIGTAVSAVYKVRVVSSAGNKVSVSPTILAIGTATPSAPATAPNFCQNASSATVSATGQALKWYATSSSTAVIGTGATLPVSTSASGSFSVYVTQTVNSCESNRTQVSYTVTATPGAPGVTSITGCQGQTLSPLTASLSSGATANWYGTTASGGTATTAAPTPSNTSSATYYVSQTVNGCESSRAALAVTIVTAPVAPTATTPPAYCVGDAAAPLSASGQNLLWYGTNATGGTGTATQTPGTSQSGTTNYYVSQTVSGCESQRTAVAVVVKSKPGAPGVSAVSYCAGQAATPLSAITANGSTVNWYGTSATGGTASTSAPTPPASATGTTNYYVSQTLDGCEGPRASLAVTINAIPAAPSVASAGPFCQGTTLQPLSASGQNLKWYGVNATGGTATASQTPDNNALGTTNYYVSQTVNNCESPRGSVAIQIKLTPGQPGTAPVEFCQNTPAPTLTATASASATLNWYVSAISSPGSSTPPVPPGSNAGTQLYYVSQTLNGCEGSRASLSVNVKPTPAAPGTSPISYCFGVSGTALTATPLTNASLNWYGTSATGGTASTSAPTPPTSAAGTTNFYVSQSLNGCEGPRASLAVTINAIPATPSVAPAGPFCQGTTLQPLSASGQNLKWYGVNATGGTATASQTPDNNALGTTNYYVSQTVNNCESPRGSVAIQIKLTPGQPGTAPVEFCQNTPAPTLTAIPTSNAVLNWYTANSGVAATTTPPAIPVATATTLVYYVSQSLDGCEGQKAGIAVRIKPTPPIPGTSPVAFCNNGSSQPLAAIGQNLTWYDQNNVLIGNSPTPNTSSVGLQTYKVSQTIEGCVSDLASLAVTINALPAAPGTSNLLYCLPTQDQPTQPVTALSAAGQNLRWYNPDGNLYNQAPTPPINQTATINYQVTQTVNNCEGPKASLQVSVQTTPAPVTPKLLVTYCRNDVATLLEASGTNLRWIDPNNTLLPANTTPTPPTLNATPQGGVFYQVYQTGSNGCVSPRTSIKVIINTNPTLSLLGSTLINLGQTTPVQLRFTGAPPFSFTLSNGISGTALNDTSVVVQPQQTTIYQVMNVANICGNGLPGNPATAVVTVKIPTITTGNLSSSTLCAGSTFSVPYSTQGDFNLDLGYRVQLVLASDTSALTPINLSTTGTTLNPIALAIPPATPGGTYFVRVVRSVATAPLIQVFGSKSPTLLTVKPLPVATLSGTQNLYEGSPTSLTLTFGGDGPWTFTYSDSTRTTTASTTVNPYLIQVQPLKTTTYQLTSVSNNCGNGAVSGTATVTVLPLLGVEEDPLSTVVKAFPVPATNRLTVDIDRPLYTEAALLELVDMRGHTTLRQSTHSKQTDLDLSTQPAGLYVLKVTLGDKQTTRKILKE